MEIKRLHGAEPRQCDPFSLRSSGFEQIGSHLQHGWTTAYSRNCLEI